MEPDQQERLAEQADEMHSLLLDPEYTKKDDLLDWIAAQPNSKLFIATYEQKWLETPQETYDRYESPRPESASDADSTDPKPSPNVESPKSEPASGGFTDISLAAPGGDAIDRTRFTGPKKRPTFAFTDGGVTTGELRRAVPTANHLTDTVFRKLTPNFQEDLIAEVASHLAAGESERAWWLKWLQGRPVIQKIYLSIHPSPPITTNVKLTFHRDWAVVLDEFRRMEPAVRRDYLYQIDSVLHSPDNDLATKCRKWLVANPDVKRAFEQRHGASVMEEILIDPKSPPLMKRPNQAFFAEFIRLGGRPKTLIDGLHDEYLDAMDPMNAMHAMKSAVRALCAMLADQQYDRMVRTMITDRPIGQGRRGTHTKLRKAMKQHIEATTHGAKRRALLAKLNVKPI